jgi:hypothetical protein
MDAVHSMLKHAGRKSESVGQLLKLGGVESSTCRRAGARGDSVFQEAERDELP